MRTQGYLNDLPEDVLARTDLTTSEQIITCLYPAKVNSYCKLHVWTSTDVDSNLHQDAGAGAKAKAKAKPNAEAEGVSHGGSLCSCCCCCLACSATEVEGSCQSPEVREERRESGGGTGKEKTKET